MFDLEQHIEDWRHQLLQGESVALTEVEELESHLRETVDELAAMIEPDEAFLLATRRVGSPDALALEFSKINGGRTWMRRTQWMLAGYLVLSLGLGLIGSISHGAMLLATGFGVPYWVAGASSCLGLVGVILSMMYWAWSVTNGSSLGAQTWVSRIGNYCKTKRRWLVVAAVLLLLVSKAGISALSTLLSVQYLGPEQLGFIAALSTLSGWTGSIILFGAITTLLCWLVSQDGQHGSPSRTSMLTAATLVAVLVFATYGLTLAGMPLLLGPQYAIF
jgi:hypothetical protein